MDPSFVSKYSLVISIVIVLFISGCLYIPPIGEQKSKEDLEKDLTHFQIGTTTKAQVIEQIGKPNLIEEDGLLLYHFIKGHGGLILVGAGGAGLVDLGGNYHIVLLEFDNNEILKRYEVETAKSILAGPLRTVPKDQTQQEKEITKAFKKSSLKLAPCSRCIVSFSPNGKMVAFGVDDGKVWLQNLVTEDQTTLKQGSWTTSPASVGSLAFFPDSTSLAFYTFSDVNIYNTETKQTLVIKYQDNGKGFTAMAIAPDGKIIATGDKYGNITFWDPVTGDEIKNIKAHEEGIISMAFSPDGHLLATAGFDESLKIFDISRQDKLVGQKQIKGVVKFSPDGKILAIHRGTHVELWEIASNVLKKSPTNNLLSRPIDVIFVPIFMPPGDGRRYLRRSLAFSPSGNRVAASYSGIVIYNLDTLEYEWRYIPRFIWEPITDLTFSPDSKSLLIAKVGGVYLWTIPNKE